MAVDDSYSKVLLHFNGDDASTTFTDESGKVWTAAGNAQLDTAQKKFGTASLYLDGTGDYASTPDHADFDIGTGAFTVDFWVRFAGEANYALFSIGDWSNCLGMGFWNGTLNISAMAAQGGVSWSPSANTWYHVAVVREAESSTFTVYRDGTSLGTWVSAKDIIPVGPATIGTIGTGEVPLNGWIDEFRVSVGIARWTSNFTPPNSEYGSSIDSSVSALFPISPLLSGTMMRGLPGDIEALFPIAPIISGTMNVPLGIDVSLAVPVSFSGTINAGSPVLLNSSLPVPIFFSSTVWSMPFVDAPGLEKSLPLFTLSTETYSSAICEANIKLPALFLTAEGEPAAIGDLSYRIPMLLLSSEATVSSEAQANISLPHFTLSPLILIGEVGEADLSLPVFTLSTELYQGIIGEASLSLPVLSLLANVVPLSTQYASLALNLKNRALTTYTNYPFNSLCTFNGIPLGAASSAIYDLNSGTTDAATTITWKFKTPYLDLEMKTKKRIKQAWLGYKSNGDITVTLSYPNGDEYEYTLDPIDNVAEGGRVKFGKGIKSKYIALEFSGAAPFELEAVRLHVDQIQKDR